MKIDLKFPPADWNSALFIILNGTKEEHLDMLDGGIIQRLLEEKWKTFARVNFPYSVPVNSMPNQLFPESIPEAALHPFRSSLLPVDLCVHEAIDSEL